MKTTCQIGFYKSSNRDLLNPDILIYRGHDGYPDGRDGVLNTLSIFIEFCAKEDDIGRDACLLLYMMVDAYVREEKKKVHPLTGIQIVSNYAISTSFELDIDYYYAVSDGVIEVYRVDLSKGLSIESFTLRESFKVKKM